VEAAAKSGACGSFSHSLDSGTTFGELGGINTIFMAALFRRFFVRRNLWKHLLFAAGGVGSRGHGSTAAAFL